jgi:predicted TIM-barrel fold metal-dependent hydrolase
MWDPRGSGDGACAAKGDRLCFGEPGAARAPTIHDVNGYWDPVMAAANDLDMVVCMHVVVAQVLTIAGPRRSWPTSRGRTARRDDLSWLFSGMSTRFPNLKIALSEGEIGWIPYFLERAEQVLDKQRYWVQRGVQFMEHATTEVDLDSIDVRELFSGHVFGCFIDDAHGIASIDEIGEDNIMCETDYPHSDSTWPDCIGVVQRLIKDLPEPVQYKILRGKRSGCTASGRPPPVPAHA